MTEQHKSETDRKGTDGAVVHREIASAQATMPREAVAPATRRNGPGPSTFLSATPFGAHLFGDEPFPNLDAGYQSQKSSTIRSAAKDGAVYGAFFVLLYLFATLGHVGFGMAALWAVGGIAAGALAGTVLHVAGKMLGWGLEVAAWLVAIAMIVFMWVAYH